MAVSNSYYQCFYHCLSSEYVLGYRGRVWSSNSITNSFWQLYITYFIEPKSSPTLDGYEVLDAGNITGYAAIDTIQRNEETGDNYIGIASNTGANKYPWGIAYFEEEITQKTNDNDPANSSMLGDTK